MMLEKKNPLKPGLVQQDESISGDLSLNLLKVKGLTGNSPDIKVRLFQGEAAVCHIQMAILYIDGLVDAHVINNDILKSFMSDSEKEVDQVRAVPDTIALIKNRILAAGSLKDVHSINNLMSDLFAGNSVLLANGWNQGISISAAEWKQRGVEEPSSQTVIRGPKEGFTENISTNITLLRRKIKNPNLWIVTRIIGRVTQTDVAILYINGIANDKVVKEILQRLDSINTDSILESGYLEEFIQDKTFTPFPTMINTERPDSVAGALLEGHIAILVDGTPFVLLAPVTFFHFLQASEDYYQRFDIASFLRILRYFAFIVSMLLPSLYIAITTFHQEMLPTTLLISLVAQKEGVPFPAFVEALLMETTFEVLREAGVRMPRAIGPAISIVGALVLGQAAVQAGLVSAAMVIVVSFTAISNFVIPAFNMAVAARLIRFALMLLAATLGLFGIMSGLIAILVHMAGLRSFGIPYLSPVAPFIANNLKDVFIRVPLWAMFTRPRLISHKNIVRQGRNLQPSPSKEKKK
ncbi:spore germination protein [Paenibacillus elgii]|uniref:spore germination protein n=1 Tax=Paenibacillus elgii TaxID=189691 RepID=UPI00049299C9|nr:spore germination protein [Paenibacillus elgii]